MCSYLLSGPTVASREKFVKQNPVLTTAQEAVSSWVLRPVLAVKLRFPLAPLNLPEADPARASVYSPCALQKGACLKQKIMPPSLLH